MANESGNGDSQRHGLFGGSQEAKISSIDDPAPSPAETAAAQSPLAVPKHDLFAKGAPHEEPAARRAPPRVELPPVSPTAQPQGKASVIFLSYVEEDEKEAQEIAASLESMGYRTWYYQRDSAPGPSYLDQVFKAINVADAFLLLISKDSLASDQVDREVVLAHEASKPVVPLLLGVNHADFQRERPAWRLVFGAAVSLVVDPNDVPAVVNRLARGLVRLRLYPNQMAGSAYDVVSGSAKPSGAITAVSAPYKSIHSLTVTIVTLQAIGLLCGLLSAIRTIGAIGTVGNAIDNHAGAASESGFWVFVVFITSLISLVLAVLVPIWTHHAHRNLPALGARSLKYHPGSAVASFFIPFVNFYRPAMVMSEIWRASDPDALDSLSWRRSRVPNSVTMWWSGVVASMVFMFVLPFMLSQTSPSGAMNTVWVSFLTILVSIATGVLAIALVMGIDARQELKARYQVDGSLAPLSEEEKARRRRAAVGPATLSVLIILLPAMFFPVFGKAKEIAKETASLSNMKQLGTGLLEYETDFDERLPDMSSAEAMKQATIPYTKSSDVYSDVATQEAFLPNDRLSFVAMPAFDEPSRVIAVYDPAKMTGDKKLVCYGDGHVSKIEPNRWDTEWRASATPSH